MNISLKVILFSLIFFPGFLLANNLQKIQGLTRELQQADQSIDNLERRIGETILQNTGPTPEYDNLNQQLRVMKDRKNQIMENIQRLSNVDTSPQQQTITPIQGQESQSWDSHQNPPQKEQPCTWDRSISTPNFDGIECTSDEH